jgi:hypothetical protein
MPLMLTETQVIALQRAIADGSLAPGALHAMLIGPSPVSASGRRQTRDLSDSPYATAAGATHDADLPG